MAEIGFGLAVLPDGKRRRTLQERFDRFLQRGFTDRILDFNLKAASVYGEIMAYRRQLGRPLSMADGQIAAIARSCGLAIATRNTKDFLNLELDLIDPYE